MAHNQLRFAHEIKENDAILNETSRKITVESTQMTLKESIPFVDDTCNLLACERNTSLIALFSTASPDISEITACILLNMISYNQ